MKKTLTLTIILIALWAISTFIISNQTQEEFNHYIERSNRLYSANGLKLTLSDYNKSFLSSTATLQINFTNPEIVKEVEKEYLLPIEISYTIEHGPLLFTDGLGFGLSRVHNQLLVSSLLQPTVKEEFLKLVKEDITLDTEMVISFSKALYYTIKSNNIEIHQENREFKMTPLNFQGVSNLQTLAGEGYISIAQLQFKEENSSNRIKIDNLTLDMDIDEIAEKKIIFGDFVFSIGNLFIHDDTNPQIEQMNIGFNAVMKSERVNETMMNSMIHGLIDFKDTKLPNELKSLKNIELAMEMKDLGIKGMSKLQEVAENSQKEQIKLLEEIKTTSPQNQQLLFKKFNRLQEKMLTDILHTFNQLLIKDKSSIAYIFKMKSEDKASTQALLEVGYTGEMEFKGTFEEIAQRVQSKILSLMRLNINIELNKKHLELLGNPMLKPQLKMGVAQGFVKENNSSYILKGYYKNGELMVNDNNLTATILPLLVMITAQ